MTRPLGLLALILLCAACQTEGPEVAKSDPDEQFSPVNHAERAVEQRIARIRYQSGQQLLDTLQQIVRYGELAVDPVLAALETADPRTRANLLWVLGYVGGPEAHPVLVEHLSHPNQAVRYEAAAGLATLGDMSGVPVLLDFLESEQKRLRYKAHEVLAASTGQDFGYVSNAPSGAREQALSRWRSWWRSERARIFEGDRAASAR